jgi:hypothetical protein
MSIEIPLQEAYENNWEILRQYQTRSIIVPEGVREYDYDHSGFLRYRRDSQYEGYEHEYKVTALDNGVLRFEGGQNPRFHYQYQARVMDGNDLEPRMRGKWLFIQCFFQNFVDENTPVVNGEVRPMSWVENTYFRLQDLRVRLENPYPNSEEDPYHIQRALKKFFYDNLPQKPFDIEQGCNHEDTCPVTGMSLAFLRNKKRLVVIDGQCYAFYAFTHEREMLQNPFTRQPWSPDARAKIRFLRQQQHISFLRNEYESMMELHEQWENANGTLATARKSRTRGRTARNRRTRTARTINDTLTGGKTLRRRCKKRGRIMA